MATEAALSKKLEAAERKRKELRRKLQLLRMKEAGKRRKANNKILRAVGALLEKQDEKTFQKLAAQLSSANQRGRRKPGRPRKSS